MAYFSLIQQLKEQVSLILDNYVVISDEGTEDDNRPAEWPDIKWWGMFQALFVNNALSSHWADEDDMLFAVFRNPAGKKAFTALRRVPGVLPKDLMYGSDMYNSIDWKASVLLNLAMHARYTLTLTVGGHDEIVAALRTGLGLTGTASASSESTAITNALQKRAFNIHPRLSRIPVDSSGRYVKVSEPDNTFPYLAFSVDDFDDDAVEPLVLWEPTDEFAVTLHAEAWPPEPVAPTPQLKPQRTASAATAAGGAASAALADAPASGQGSVCAGTGQARNATAAHAPHPVETSAADAAEQRAPRGAAGGGGAGEAALGESPRPAGADVAACANACKDGDCAGGDGRGGGVADGGEAGCGEERDWPHGRDPSAGEGAPDVCMFRGYVDHGQVLTTVRRRQPSRLLSALMPAGISAPPQRPAASAGAARTDGDCSTDPPQPRPPSYFIRMTGPRGRGRAEVAVSSRASPRPAPPTQHTPYGPQRSSASSNAYPGTPAHSAAAAGSTHSTRGDQPHATEAGSKSADASAGGGRGGCGGVAERAGSADKTRQSSRGQRGLLGSFSSAAKALGRAFVGPPTGAAAVAAAEPAPPQFECRFICLMLSVEDVVTALLGLHTV